MTKTKLKKIMKSDAEIWVTTCDASDSIVSMLYQGFEEGSDECEVAFKVITDAMFDVTYVVCLINDDVDVLFPNSEKNQAMLKEFLLFVEELNEDFEEFDAGT